MNVERLILECLDNVGSLAMPKTTLFSEVRLDAPGTSYTEFESALRNLGRKGQVEVVPGEDRDKVKILEAGAARLSE